MKRQRQHKNSSRKIRNRNLLKLCVFAVWVYFSALFFIVPSVFAAVVTEKTDDIGKSDSPDILSFITQDYRYDSAANIDPFFPYLIRREELIKTLEEQQRKENDVLTILRSMQEIRTELQKFDITQLTLSSIISGSNGMWAMVIDPTGAGHVIKKNSLIGKNGGVVDQIIRKIERSEYGSKYIRKVIIKEPYISQKGDIEYRFIEKDLVNPYYD